MDRKVLTMYGVEDNVYLKQVADELAADGFAILSGSPIPKTSTNTNTMSKHGTYEGSFRVGGGFKAERYIQYFDVNTDATNIVNELDDLIFKVDSSGNVWDWDKKAVGSFRFFDSECTYWSFIPQPGYFPENVEASLVKDPTHGVKENYLIKFERIVFEKIFNEWCPVLPYLHARDYSIKHAPESVLRKSGTWPNGIDEAFYDNVSIPQAYDDGVPDRRRFGNNRKDVSAKERARKKIAQKSRAAQRKKK